jgi:hypothetical protein
MAPDVNDSAARIIAAASLNIFFDRTGKQRPEFLALILEVNGMSCHAPHACMSLQGVAVELSDAWCTAHQIALHGTQTQDTCQVPVRSVFSTAGGAA